MTVSVTTTRELNTGNGSTTAFPFTMRLTDVTHLDVYVNNVQKTYSTDFTVAIDSSGVGGTVTFVTAPANAATIVFIRNVPYTQPTRLPLTGGLPSGTLEAAYDRAVMQIQQLAEQLDRTIKLAITTTLTDGLTLPEPDALKFLRWTADKLALENAEVTTPTFTIPSFTGNTNRYIRVNTAETNFEYRTLAQTQSDLGIGSASGTKDVGDAVVTFKSAANSLHLLAYGQAVSRSTYSTLFTAIGTTYGAGDGSTTFNLPDVRGRALFGKDNMGGSAASRIAVNGTTLGGTGGAETTTNFVTHNHSITTSNATFNLTTGGTPINTKDQTSSTTGNAGTGASVNIMNPYIIANVQIFTGV